MYTDNFLSQKKLSYLCTEKSLDKTRCTSEKYDLNEVFKTAFCSYYVLKVRK